MFGYKFEFSNTANLGAKLKSDPNKICHVTFVSHFKFEIRKNNCVYYDLKVLWFTVWEAESVQQWKIQVIFQ